MAALALRDALPDFGAKARAATPADGPVAAPSEPAQPPRYAEPDPEVIRQAVIAAERALAEKLNTQHEAALAALSQVHAAEAEEIRREAASIAGAEMALRLDAIEARLIELTGSATARIIASFLTPELQTRAIAELTRVIRETLADRDVQRIRVSGPASFREAIIPALGAYADKVDFAETGDMDVSVSIDETILETQMAEWSAALAEVLD